MASTLDIAVLRAVQSFTSPVLIGAPGSPVNGQQYYDTTMNLFQFYQNGAWVGLGSGAANPFLSNLQSPTAINQSLYPGVSDTYQIGSMAKFWTNVWSDIFNVMDGEVRFYDSGNTEVAAITVQDGNAIPDGTTGVGLVIRNILIGNAPENAVAFTTSNDSTANATATGTLYFETGNKTGGTGPSGDIYFITGSSLGGAQGRIYFDPEIRILGANSGYVGFAAEATTTPYTLYWPNAQAPNDGSSLENDGAGNLTWVNLHNLLYFNAGTFTANAGFTLPNTNSYLQITSTTTVTSDGTTAITSGLFSGQIMIVENTGSNTINFVNGANCNLPTGVNYALTPGSLISFIWNGTVWNTFSASDNS